MVCCLFQSLLQFPSQNMPGDAEMICARNVIAKSCQICQHHGSFLTCVLCTSPTGSSRDRSQSANESKMRVLRFRCVWPKRANGAVICLIHDRVSAFFLLIQMMRGKTDRAPETGAAQRVCHESCLSAWWLGARKWSWPIFHALAHVPYHQHAFPPSFSICCRGCDNSHSVLSSSHGSGHVVILLHIHNAVPPTPVTLSQTAGDAVPPSHAALPNRGLLL